MLRSVLLAAKWADRDNDGDYHHHHHGGSAKDDNN